MKNHLDTNLSIRLTKKLIVFLNHPVYVRNFLYLRILAVGSFLRAEIQRKRSV